MFIALGGHVCGVLSRIFDKPLAVIFASSRRKEKARRVGGFSENCNGGAGFRPAHPSSEVQPDYYAEGVHGGVWIHQPFESYER